MGPFNSREIATAFWLLLFAVGALSKPDIRRAAGRIVQSFCHVKVFLPAFLLFVYVIVTVAGLKAVGVWRSDLIKDTIVWFCFSGIAMLARFVTADRPGNAFRETMIDSIKVVILVEFLINTYTFPLAVELILVPLLTLIAMLDAVASMKKEYTAVAKVLKGIQMVLGLTILAAAARQALADWHNLDSLDTLRSVALAPILSVFMLPFMYLLLVYSKYETIFVRLNFGTPMPPDLKRYAHCRILMHAGLRLWRLESLLDSHVADLMFARTKPEVDAVLLRAKNAASTTEQGP
jgi:hypothetical protein